MLVLKTAKKFSAELMTISPRQTTKHISKKELYRIQEEKGFDQIHMIVTQITQMASL